MYSGVKIETVTKTETTITVNGHDISEVVDMAKELAHQVCEDASILRQRYNVEDGFLCEGTACRFLDMIGD